MELDAKAPSGPIECSWDHHRADLKLVNPSNKRKHTILVVGTGLAGGAAAASLAELGYRVESFCFQDSPRRAHSIAAQGGINAAKNYQNDGDSVWRLFYDTVKGGDYRSREANVYRLSLLSANIIDQCVAQGVPFAREYGGLLANRSFGGAQVSRTFYARGQTGQQLLLGAYSAMMRQVGLGRIGLHPRTEMLDLIVIDGRTRGLVVRDLVSGEISSHFGDAVLLATGGYSNVFYLSTNARGSNCTAIWRAYKRGAGLANPCFTQIHPTCIPVTGEHQSKLTLMSESLRNDGRIWVPRKGGDDRSPNRIPEVERDYYLERRYPTFGNLVPRDVASRAAKERCDAGYGVGPGGHGVYLDFTEALRRLGRPVIEERYGNLFEMYNRITDENPYESPMRIYPAPHYTMGGLWVDYNLMSTIPGLFVLGEANFSDHGANRLGASALMQGLADGYFIIPYTVSDYLASTKLEKVAPDHPSRLEAEAAVKDRTRRLLELRGRRTVDSFHRELGLLVWNQCGMTRNEAGLRDALERIPRIREEFWKDAVVTGSGESLNQTLERAARVADHLGAGRAHGPGRARTKGIGRRSFPRGEPDRGRRGAAGRRAFHAREHLGASGRRGAAPVAQRAAGLSVGPSDPEELPVNLKLRVWRQAGPGARGRMVSYEVTGLSPDMSFLEMLDVLNSRLELTGQEPIAFDSDCREGICGSCALMINGIAHGPEPRTAACQLFLRHFRDGETVWVEPWRSRAFPVVRDLVTDRSAFDRIIEAGGFISLNTGGAPDANAIPIRKDDAERAMDAAACIGCGACVASCPNGSAMLFTAAKISHSGALAPGTAGAVRPGRPHDRGHGSGRLRPLHESSRMRGGLPEGDQDVQHRPTEPRSAPRRLPELDPAGGNRRRITSTVRGGEVRNRVFVERVDVFPVDFGEPVLVIEPVRPEVVSRVEPAGPDGGRRCRRADRRPRATTRAEKRA